MKTLGDVAQIIMGQSPDGSTTSAEKVGLPLLNGPTEFGGHHPHPVQYTSDARKKAQKNDLLFCVRGSTTGKMNWADQDYAIGRGIAAIRHKTGVDFQHFVRAVVEHGLPNLLVQATGSTFPNVAYSQLSTIPYPDLSEKEQRTIAHVLGVLDDKIELNRRMNATLEGMAQTLFRSWFVDFDPVTAKAEGREPDGMDAETAALFPSAFVESELGPIPEGWTVGTVADMCDINPSRKLTANIDAPYLDMANVPTHSARVLHVYNRPVGSGMKFQNGDTLVARITPCLENGKTAYVDFLEDGQVGWGSTEFIVLHPKPVFPAVYGYFLARTEEFRNNAIANMTGTSGRQRVPADAIARYKVVVPNAEVAGSFGTLVNDALLKIQANDNQSSTLTTLRDELLYKLISGELRLPEAMVAEFADAKNAPNAIK